RSHPNAPSESRSGLGRALTGGPRSGERPLELDDLLETLWDAHRAADDVVHDRHRLRVVLRVPRLLVGRDDLALLVLLAQELQIDPLVVRLDDLRVVVHLGVRIVESRDETPLA